LIFNRNLLAIAGMSYIGVHTYFILTLVFNKEWYEAGAFVAIVELFMYKISKCGLASWKSWLIKIGIFICSVGFSIFGHFSEVLKFEETILTKGPVKIVETKDIEIAKKGLEKANLVKILKKRENNHEYYLEKGEKEAYKTKFGNSVSGFSAIKVNDRKMQSLKSEIAIIDAEIKILEAQNKNVFNLKAQNSLKKSNISKANVYIRWRTIAFHGFFAFVIIVVGIGNMFLTNNDPVSDETVTVLGKQGKNSPHKHRTSLTAFEEAKLLEYRNIKDLDKEGKKPLLAFCLPFINLRHGPGRAGPRLE
jgi:hypothetical protein